MYVVALCWACFACAAPVGLACLRCRPGSHSSAAVRIRPVCPAQASLLTCLSYATIDLPQEPHEEERAAGSGGGSAGAASSGLQSSADDLSPASPCLLATFSGRNAAAPQTLEIGCVTTLVATSAPAGRWPAHLAQGPWRTPQGTLQREVLDRVGLVQPAAGRRLPG